MDSRSDDKGRDAVGISASSGLSIKKILPFCTHEGSGMGRSERDIKKLCPNADVAKGLAINGSSCNSAEASVKKWLSSNGL